jgi:hypothetical protein
VKSAFKYLTHTSTDEYKKRIMPSIDFWEEEFKKVRGNEELDEYRRWACLNNIALSYFWMDDFVNARNTIDRMDRIRVKNGDTRRLLNLLEETVYRIEKANLSGQHFFNKKLLRGV